MHMYAHVHAHTYTLFFYLCRYFYRAIEAQSFLFPHRFILLLGKIAGGVLLKFRDLRVI